MDEFNMLAPELPLRYWKVRFVKELEVEEFQVAVNPKGQIVKFIHNVPEDEEGANLKQEQALIRAQGFIQQQEGTDHLLSKYTLINTSTKKREKRTDHIFTWEASEQHLGEARLRMTVGIHGDVVDWFSQHVEVPETFGLAREGEGSKGNLLTSISEVFDSFLILLAVVIFLIAHKKIDIPWRGGLALAVIMAVASLLEDLNGIPNMKSAYSTESPLYIFWSKAALDSIESALWLGVKTFLFAIAGWALCREVFKGKRTDWIVRGQDWLSSEFGRASFMGYILAGISLGYVTSFYLIGEKYLGVWSPVPSSYSNMLSTWIPLFDPLTGSFQAAVSEELMYRFFAIALLIKYLRLPFLALLIPAMIWAFGHSNYDVSPFYTRGIELTIDGLVFGYFFLRYGLITVIVAHYVFDAIIGGMPLIQSSNAYLFWSGMIVISIMAIPAVLGIIWMLREKIIVWTGKVATHQ
jgi:hypothetical protein